MDEKGKFREDSFQKALNALVPAGEGDKKRQNGKWQKGILAGKPSEESDIFKMVKMIIQRQYDPVILFSFSKRECEFLAMQVSLIPSVYYLFIFFIITVVVAIQEEIQ